MDFEALINAYKRMYPKIKDIHIGCPFGLNDLAILNESTPAGPAGAAAHSHLSPNEISYHHICVCHPAYLKDETIAHEYAHIMTDIETHQKGWVDSIVELGYLPSTHLVLSFEMIEVPVEKLYQIAFEEIEKLYA